MDSIASYLSNAIYRIKQKSKNYVDPNFNCFIASTPQTRRICNDSIFVGIDYTDALKASCAQVLSLLQKNGFVSIQEQNTVVLHVLRGGINFGLREALNIAFGWNIHASAFISAQRARNSDDAEDWHITESSYQKIQLPKTVDLIFGDVVATGTSLAHALDKILDECLKNETSIRSIVFLTIGGPRSEEIVGQINSKCKKMFPNYQGASVVYFEGRFAVAAPETPISIKYTGTDLLRRDSLLAPDFIQSQYENPLYPLERCTIYDAGSRAFYLPEYLEDVLDYWKQTLELAKNGMSFKQLLSERFPELDPSHFEDYSLEKLCQQQIQNIEAVEKSDSLPNAVKAHST